MAQTEHYKLYVEDSGETTFQEWRRAMNGPDNSNMTKIEDALLEKQDKLTAGDGMSIQDGTISVATPVKGVFSQEEFDALPEEQRNQGMYIIPDGEDSGGGGLTLEEADRRYFSIDTFRLDGGIETQSLHFETQFIPERLEFIRDEDGATVSIHPSRDPIGIPWNDYGVRLDGVLAPDHDYGAANKQYVDGLLAGKQDRLTGARGQVVGFNAQGQAVAQAAPDTGVVSFKGRKGAVTPQSGDYTAAQVGALPIAGGTMTGPLSVQAPTQGSHAATKQYVDGALSELRALLTAHLEKIVTLSYYDINGMTVTVNIKMSPYGPVGSMQYTLKYSGTIPSLASGYTNHLTLSPPPGYAFTNLAQTFVPKIKFTSGTTVTGMSSGSGIIFNLNSSAEGNFTFYNGNGQEGAILCLEVE